MKDISEGSKVAQFYNGQTLFITGASGFMGKVLLEKLLYACPGITKIFILVRHKRGKTPENRLEEMSKLPVFHRIRKDRPDAFKKLVLIQGDVLEDGLGLSPVNKMRLQSEVTVMFHSAATLRLEAKLKDAVEMNLLGTQRVLELAKKMNKLKVLIHLSTAFCHCDYDILEEKVYPAPTDPENVIRLVNWMSSEELDKVTPGIISPHPNTYTYTKRLAEALVYKEFPNLPVVIARPSIVTPAVEEPLPGWVDNLNGPVGIMVAAGKGVLRSMHCNGSFHSEVIPVDYAINGLIQIAAKCGSSDRRPAEIPVYNLTVAPEKRTTWQGILELGIKYIYDYPFEMTVWYPDGNIRASKFMHNICVIFLHFLPAYFIDFLLLLFMQKRFMVRIQWKIQDGLEFLQYFTTRQWNFSSNKFQNLGKECNNVDKELFSIDFNKINDDEYMKNTLLGARQYCMKEDLSSLPRCRRNLKILYVIDRLWAMMIYGGIFWLLYSCSETVRFLLDTSVEYLMSAPFVRNFVDSSNFKV